MDRAATKDIFAYCTQQFFLYRLFLSIINVKNINNGSVSTRITMNPLIIQFGLLCIKERLGPTKDVHRK
jgi:hypothetical protein